MKDKTVPAYQQPKPYPGLKSLDKLVGTWNVTGPNVSGQVTFELMEGGFFLIQHVDLVQGGYEAKGMEIIGYDRGFGQAEPSKDIKSHYFDNNGNTFGYTYEVTDETLTIWGGERDSPAYYTGKWSHDGTRNTGAWTYPDGRGYESSMTKIA